MKITMISYTTDLAALGGGGMHVKQLSRALAKRGNEVTVITAFDHDLHFREQWPQGDLDNETTNALEAGDADVIAWKMSDRPPRTSYYEDGVCFIQVNAPESDVSDLWGRRWVGLSDSEMKEMQLDLKDEKIEDRLTRHIWGEWVNNILSKGDFDLATLIIGVPLHFWNKEKGKSAVNSSLPLIL